jgi:hypothetical protein
VAITLVGEKRRVEGRLDVCALGALRAQPALDLDTGLVARLIWRTFQGVCCGE